jgi:hypothetical protein
VLLDTSDKVYLEVNIERTNCMFMSYDQTAGQNCNITFRQLPVEHRKPSPVGW